MPTTDPRDYRLDARPDRIDFRDYEYRPPLSSLPAQFPEDIDGLIGGFADAGMVLDQGPEGACTGFGLAATVHHLLWCKRDCDDDPVPPHVSPRMLYHMARFYDEWPGEDYAGSSCRGAMKGWHRHGICADEVWPYRDEDETIRYIEPQEGWADDAAARPLGAYYRIEKDSIVAMQSAIRETGAVFASANIHEGWYTGPTDTLSVMPRSEVVTGGHAFALVGYLPEGFIVQNSWGDGWGRRGFAILGYEDWVANGHDAWVAVMGAPMRVTAPPQSFSHVSLTEHATGLQAAEGNRRARARSVPRSVRPWSESRAYHHSVVLGNNGLAINRLVDAETPAAAVARVTEALPFEWLESRPFGQRRVAIYAHGGLTDEADAVAKARVLAPYYMANGIYPLFLAWRTGALETIASWIEDRAISLFKGTRAAGPLDEMGEALREARDRAIEVAAAGTLAKAMWTETKQNAKASLRSGHALSRMAEHLDEVSESLGGVEFHLVGQSAGALLLGHLLDKMRQRDMQAQTVTLYAPGCSLNFTNSVYGRAARAGVFDPSDLHVHALSDKRERDDRVAAYGKSVLYLVSRALEVDHKTPLLGLSCAWRAETAADGTWAIPPHRKSNPDVGRWVKGLGTSATLHEVDSVKGPLASADGTRPATHESLDEDVMLAEITLKRILDEDSLRQRVLDLRGV